MGCWRGLVWGWRPFEAFAPWRRARGKRLRARPGTGFRFTFTMGPRSFWSSFVVVPRFASKREAASSRKARAVFFPVGPEGVHGLANETDEPVRYLMASTLPSPEVAEYPDHHQITAQARTGSQTGETLWLIHDLS